MPPRLSDPDFQAWEARIHAFVALDDRADVGDAANADDPGPLCGLRVGVKDIIDVAGLPTRNGSRAYDDATPATEDAAVVRALRNAGAQVVGKTTTTEFAFTDPTDCRNPHALERSPGGSSSGSGAAVAAGLVDCALGTQTAGSLCRPAAYCGAVGLKPSYGSLPMAGVTPLAPSFDTVGVIARSVALAAKCFRVMRGVEPRSAPRGDRPVTLTTLLDPSVTPDADTLAALSGAEAALRDFGSTADRVTMAVDASRVVADHGTVMTHEAAKAHGHLLSSGTAGLLQPKFRAGLQAGVAVSAQQAEDAAGRLGAARSAFWAGLAGVDIILTLPVPEGAPRIDGTTGFQTWLTPWTVFGGPLVCLPWGLDRLGRPRSVMLAAHPGHEALLLETAEALAGRAPALAPPRLPR